MTVADPPSLPSGTKRMKSVGVNNSALVALTAAMVVQPLLPLAENCQTPVAALVNAVIAIPVTAALSTSAMPVCVASALPFTTVVNADT